MQLCKTVSSQIWLDSALVFDMPILVGNKQDNKLNLFLAAVRCDYLWGFIDCSWSQTVLILKIVLQDKQKGKCGQL